MPTALELLHEGQIDEIWRKYCGFIDLNMTQFMDIQKRLLMEQIRLQSNCELGRAIMGAQPPKSVEEFRQRIPLTTYEDYADFLDTKRTNALPEMPDYWIRTSGRSQANTCKWAPYPKRFLELGTRLALASIIFSSSRRRGDFVMEENDRFLYAMAPPPFISGMLPYGIQSEFAFKFLPSVQEAERLTFQERTATGFELALREGLSVFFGLGSVLVRIGDQFSHASSNMKPSRSMLHPAVLGRLLRGLARSRLARRPMIPADLWDLKGIISAGTDTAVYRDRIKYFWGREPIEMYGGTEINFIATQTWDYGGMTFVPDTGFLEFIPEQEHLRSKEDSSYQPCTVLLSEVKAGEKYEFVITNFNGGAFIRYRIGDLIKITALRNDNLNIDIPQMQFWSRADDIIDLAGFCRLTERIIWQAIEAAKLGCKDWVACKEFEGSEPTLHLYLEVHGDHGPLQDIKGALDQSLREIDATYAELHDMLGLDPLRITLLQLGTFQRYTEDRLAAGVELAHLKPAHMRPNDETLRRLLAFSHA